MPDVPVRRLLEGQTAVATGASSGIGKAIAIELGKAGANVIVNFVTGPEQAEEVAAEIEKDGSHAVTAKADVSKEAEVQAMFATAKAEFGTVDILVNNAGLQSVAPFCEMTLAQRQRVIDVNLTGQFLCAREAVREFKARGVRPDVSCAAGKIVCISSVHEVIPWAGHVNYAELLKLIPYKRIGEPNEIGRAAAWLASDDADYIHGITLFVDGGMTLYPGFETGG